jgi:N-acetylmuramoyl-L-alanine amidase
VIKTASVLFVAATIAAGIDGAGADRGSVTAPRPMIVQSRIPFPQKRKLEMKRYAHRHYGLRTYRLRSPRVIVEHYTGGESYRSAYDTFAHDAPDPELHELPGLCAHFVIDKAGVIHQLVSVRLMCRHTVGLNWTAIGIEHVGASDGEVLGNVRELDASLRLTRWLQARFGIRTRNVIGHSESLDSPYHRERVPALAHQTHGDFRHATMKRYRRLLSRRGSSATMLERRPLGRSVRGRQIEAVELSDQAARRKVLVVGALHGDETAGIDLVRHLERSSPPCATNLWLIENLNPDGAAARTRQNAHGVDLNRNFPWGWRRLGRRGDQQYSGPRPLSEPETRIARSLIRRLRPRITIWFHQPLRFVDRSGGDVEVERRFARLSGLPLRRIRPYPGTATRWQNRRFPGSTAFAVELPPGPLTVRRRNRYAAAILGVSCP